MAVSSTAKLAAVAPAELVALLLALDQRGLRPSPLPARHRVALQVDDRVPLVHRGAHGLGSVDDRQDHLQRTGCPRSRCPSRVVPPHELLSNLWQESFRVPRAPFVGSRATAIAALPSSGAMSGQLCLAAH